MGCALLNPFLKIAKRFTHRNLTIIKAMIKYHTVQGKGLGMFGKLQTVALCMRNVTFKAGHELNRKKKDKSKHLPREFCPFDLEAGQNKNQSSIRI